MKLNFKLSLLAVSSIVKQGYQVVFAEEDSHIALSNGVKIPMKHVNGTYELEIWVKNPGFTRQGR